MSKNINVNPDHYKVAGRERTDDLAKERMKAARQEVVRNKRVEKHQKPPTRHR